MGFGKRRGGGDFLPLLKFDARNGSLHLERGVHGPGGWVREQVDVGSRFRAVFDLANAQVGWVKFPRGRAPETVLVPVGQDAGEPPDEDFKEGFRILALMDVSLGGGVHEFMSTSVSAWNGVSALHDLYLAERDQHPGQLPLVGVEEIVERTYANGNSFEPVFIILKWVPRPEEFGAQIEPALKQPPPRQAPSPRARAEMEDEIPF
jgi:hypothetical protein